MPTNVKKISIAVIKRLPRYHRYLGNLLLKDIERISSQELSKLMGITASQIRQDLSNFGGFGQQGYGYKVKDLYEQINKILGIGNEYNIIIIGSGNLGQAIANYGGFREKGFVLKGMFDKNPKLIGLKLGNIEIMDIDSLKEFALINEIDIGVLCVPSEVAPDIARTLYESKVKAIWNFAPVDLNLPEDIIVENVHLSDSLFTLSYKIQTDKIKNKFKQK